MDFCQGEAEGWGPWSSERQFDLTPCFENTAVLQVPKLVLILIALPRLILISKRISHAVPLSAIYHAKIILPSCISIIAIANYAYLGFTSSTILQAQANLGSPGPAQSDLLDLISTILVNMFATYLHHIEHVRSAISSTALLFYWLLNLIAHIIKLRTVIYLDTTSNLPDPLPHSTIISEAIIVILCLILFVLENRPKPKPYYASLLSAHYRTSFSEGDISDDEEADDIQSLEHGKEDTTLSPEIYANVFSRLSFHWMDGLMKEGFRKDLTMDDLWGLRSMDSARVNSDLFHKYWNEQVANNRPSLLLAIARAYGPLFASAALLKAIQDALSFVQPTFLKMMMEFTSSWAPENKGEQMPLSRGFSIAIMMLCTALTQTVFLHQYFHICILVGMRLKSAIITAVYRKALRLSNTSRQGSTVGEIVNLMSVDASRIGDLTAYLHILWSGPFQIGLALYFLYASLGPSIFAGVAVMILMIPINGWIAAKSRALNKEQMGNKDARTKLMDEILSGIKVIKLYAWEKAFLGKIGQVRERELSTLRRIGILSAASTFTWACTPFLVSFLSFVLYTIISDEPLTSTKVFVALSLFNLLQFPLTVFPSVITSTIDASVSFSRLYKFLMNEELDPEAVLRLPVQSNDDPTSPRILMKQGVFRWAKEGRNIIDGVSLSVCDKGLVAVVGMVGSGKSSLIASILGEMYKISGEVSTRGTIAYVSQTPWIMNSTLRENITFGKRFEAKRYEETIAACGLKPDLEMLPGGDMTEIGERGINLSGGQKQRISLARAVYANADIYLLDDTLSAVDAHVGRHIFDKVIGPHGLLASKSRLFITHSLQFLAETTFIHLLSSSGTPLESGSFKSLMANPASSLCHLMREVELQRSASEASLASSTEVAPGTVTADLKAQPHGVQAHDKPKQQQVKLMTVEESAKGSVDLNVYISYATSCGVGSVIAYLLVAVFSQGLSIMQNLYLADWADSNDRRAEKILKGLVGNTMNEDVVMRLSVYGFLGLTYAVSVIFQVIFVWIYCGIRSARILHNNMLENVLHLPQSYFDTTPLGRIINRFSKDVYTVDEVLPRTFQTYFRTLFNVLSVLFVNALGNWMFILFVVPLGVLYMYFQRYYLSTSRELKRLDSTSRSPIFAHFQETLIGATTIRAYTASKPFIYTNEHKVDTNQRAYYPSVASNRWLAVRLETIGSLIVFGSALFGVIAIALNGFVSASLVGLALTYALNVTQSLNWMVRQSCEIETNIVSVERMKEYIELKQEAPHEIPATAPKSPWPRTGCIEFKGYQGRYREGLDLVLKGVDFVVEGGLKVGVVGRTGAGKSSLTLALFRIIEAAGGSICIDGVDISKLGLKTLRSAMTIIPQDPWLFTGSVRDNLDPFFEYSDAEVWASLEAVELKSVVMAMTGKLDAPIVQGGENLSVGQRQLICLARAVLRQSKIMILDEATASIDYETDALIQATIRDISTRNQSTVFTIAHRINTIVDYDRILVLDGGCVVEYDAPKVLLERKGGWFYGLAKEAGVV